MLKIDEVREVIEMQKNNEISFSKMVELLNEKSFEWIDVSEDLPNEMDAVLCVDEFGYMQVSGYSGFWYSKLTGEKLTNGKITHWGYLPCEPKKLEVVEKDSKCKKHGVIFDYINGKAVCPICER